MILNVAHVAARFRADDSGATPVEWVSLAAAGLAILFSAFAIVSAGVETSARDTLRIANGIDMSPGFIPVDGGEALPLALIE